MNFESVKENFQKALAFRGEPSRDSALRLLNGFTEQVPGLVIDLFAGTAVIHDYSPDGEFERNPEPLRILLLENLPWLKAVVLKKRTAGTPEERNGILIHGVKPDTEIRENGVRYAIDLTMNRDNSFYHDTRLLRQWLKENMKGLRVLNTFAYTGSLGVAAAAGGAEFVLQTDLSDKFLDLCRKSMTLNRLYFNKKNFAVGDFFSVIGRLKREKAQFDCVILDPPFFSKTGKGTVDLAADPLTPINKVRPLIADGGYLVTVNNSLYLSGEDFLGALDRVCDGNYLSRETIIPVPSDFTGFDPDYRNCYAADPAPFPHPTKIVVLRVKKRG